MSSTTFQIRTPDTREWPVVAIALALVASLIFLFHGGLANLWFRWGDQQELSHSYFIPLISAWMLWERRDALRESVGRPSWLGIPLLLFGALMVFALKQLEVFVLEHVGLIVAIYALPLLIGGPSLLRVSAVPLAYLIFMIPPPYWAITVTSAQFQLWSSQLGVAMIQLFDVPVFLQGNVIDLGVMQLQVVEACSGLRYLFPFVSLAVIAAYFYKGPLWQRAIVVISAIPITIFMNSFRIAITGLLSAGGDASHTEGFLHFFEGWVVFILCIVILLGVLVGIARLSGKRNVLQGLGLPDVEPARPSKPWDRQRFMMVGGVAVAMLLVSGSVVHSIETTLYYPERREYAELPLEFPGWKIEQTPLDVATEQVLAADDYIIMNMTSPEGENFNLYTAYLNQHSDGSSWHSPRQCLPGGGWAFMDRDIVSTPEGAPDYSYNRIIIQKGESRFLVYYWFQQRGHRIANEFVMKGVLMWDVITRRRSDGAMIRLMTPIGPNEPLAEADERLQRFQRRIEETIDPYIPS